MNTKQATLVFCALCGSPTTQVNSWKKGETARLGCSECGGFIDVKGASVGELPVEVDLLALAEKQARRAPTDYKTTEAQRKAAAANRPTRDKGWVSLSFRVTEGQRDVVRQAMAEHKVAAGLTGRVWHGTAIEAICAEYLAGARTAYRPPLTTITAETVKDLAGEDLDMLAIAVFGMTVRRVFPDDDALRKWIVDEAPPEYAGDGEGGECE